MRLRLIGLILCTGMLTACGGDKEVELEYVETPVEVLYHNAIEALEKEDYFRAAPLFDEVERQHPYSAWARRAMVMSSYSYYLQNSYDETILTGKRFLSLYPGNSQAPYVQYLIAQSYYEQISDVSRDQKTTELARAAFIELVRRYPDSDYARDARLKLDLTADNLAGKEMEIGRYYLNRGGYIAAAKRFSNVIKNYQTTSHVPEALHRLVEVYISLGVVAEAQTAAAILGHNYPNNQWYEDSYRLLTGQEIEPEIHEDSWLNKVWNWVS